MFTDCVSTLALDKLGMYLHHDVEVCFTVPTSVHWSCDTKRSQLQLVKLYIEKACVCILIVCQCE